MVLRKLTGKIRRSVKAGRKRRRSDRGRIGELVIITGMSGSGKASVLKALEDLGYYCVDNLPIGLIPNFAELSRHSEIERTALVVDIREGEQLGKLPSILKLLKRVVSTKLIFLEASDEVLMRRFSETRRPHPLGKSETVPVALETARKRLVGY